jgi:hypothetical protein
MVTLRFSIVAAFVLFTLGISSVFAQSYSRSYTFTSNPKQGYLGVEVQDVTQRLKEKKHLSTDHGAYVTNVIEDSPAEKAGVQEGDVIVKVGDRTVDDGDDLTRAVRKNKPGTDVKIEVYRKQDLKMLTATLTRVQAPEAYAYGFGNGFNVMPRIPKIPKMPQSLRRLRVMISHEMYGLEVQDLTKQLGEFFEVPGGKGVLVAEVKKGTEAEKAGFKAGDVITKANSNAVHAIDDLREELYDNDSDKDRDVSFDVLRKGKPATLKMHITRDAEDSEGDNDGEEDDDDYSQNFIIPHGDHTLRTFQFRMQSPVHHFDFRDLREKLQNLKENLRDQLRNIRESIKEIIAQVHENGSSVATSILFSSLRSALGQPVIPLVDFQPHVCSSCLARS